MKFLQHREQQLPDNLDGLWEMAERELGSVKVGPKLFGGGYEAEIHLDDRWERGSLIIAKEKAPTRKGALQSAMIVARTLADAMTELYA